MVVVVWSPQALDDIESIAQYIARDSMFYAKAVTEKIVATAGDLPKFPQSGRIVPEFNQPDIREKFVYSYRLIYQISQNNIEILAVIHGKRLLENAS